MTTSRKGKIARLPSKIREALNLRLQEGEPGICVVEWLNALPEVQAALAERFGGRAINEQNLSDWKQGGFRDWEELEEERRLTLRLTENSGCIRDTLGDREPAECLIPRLVVQVDRLISKCLRSDYTDPADERRFFKIFDRVLRLRAFEHKDAKLALELGHSFRPVQRPPQTPAAEAGEQGREKSAAFPESVREFAGQRVTPIVTPPPAAEAAGSASASARPRSASNQPPQDVNQGKSRQIKEGKAAVQPAEATTLPMAPAGPSSPTILPPPGQWKQATGPNGPQNPLAGTLVPLSPGPLRARESFTTLSRFLSSDEKKKAAEILGMPLETFESCLAEAEGEPMAGALLQEHAG